MDRRISPTVTPLKALARFTDSLSFLYLEHAVIERDSGCVAAFTKHGRISIPAANLSVLMLGPGTRITHAAMAVLGTSGVVVAWVGADALRYYAGGRAKTAHSQWLGRQAQLWSDKDQHLQVVRRMYELRFGHPIDPGLGLPQIRGMEGARVRTAYAAAAAAAGIEWHGRLYRQDQWVAADPVNRALSAANAALYAVCTAGILSLGCSPALGFIHVGKALSFAYDVADLYKMEVSVPAAFAAVADGASSVESRARAGLRDRLQQGAVLDRIVRDIQALLGLRAEDSNAVSTDDVPAELWDGGAVVHGGVSYGGDDLGSGQTITEG